MVIGAGKATPPDAFAGSLGAESNEGHCCLTAIRTRVSRLFQ